MVKFMRTEMAKDYAQTCELFQSNWITYPINRVWSNIKKHHVPLFENIQSGCTFDVSGKKLYLNFSVPVENTSSRFMLISRSFPTEFRIYCLR